MTILTRVETRFSPFKKRKEKKVKLTGKNLSLVSRIRTEYICNELRSTVYEVTSISFVCVLLLYVHTYHIIIRTC